MFALTNVMRDYPWGSATAIAELLGTEPGGGPEAELWMGAHPDSPSTANTPDGPVALDALIAAHPDAMLGAEVHAAFGAKLPFLTKLLAADSALSLQVHPTLSRARERFADEEAAGVAKDATDRNYKDDNHKPEMLFALSNFEALCGFRPCAEAADLFREVSTAISTTGAGIPELLNRVIMTLNSRMVEPMVIRGAFEALIDGGAEARALVDLAASALADAPGGVGGLSAPLRTVVDLARQYPSDPGVLISLLLNRVSLAPGQAVYLPAGNIHAYLSGLGLEVMASSDNVMRGGLTGKHVDVAELMATVDFAPVAVPHVPTRTTDLGQSVWEPPFAEFALQRVELGPGSEPVPLVQNGPLLVLAVSGSVLLDSPRGDAILARGGSVFVPAAENPVMVHPHVGDDGESAVVFAVTVAG
ncbi:mannose-6-phosphate isomerase [Arthrobacter sp. ERGS1:01]|uniref:mannose-6-phosphate isomerase, class I n=1 Tax=Arthrobacter sp. ERGS1:01 TaxID=1704044 RepID=UPI0006B59AB8|nr:mannose-6-phosphate isomerase, class I [Arthrobacter sp. ERGS1:01]ALE05112.1 mannose-6-phosphate isomerase [Arthrobacter sp. ERGS1:01]